MPWDAAKPSYYIWERYLYVWDNGQVKADSVGTIPSCNSWLNWSGGFNYAYKDVSSEKSGGAGVTISGLTMSGTMSHTSSTNIKFRENGGTMGGGICSNWATTKFVPVR